jgi:hypothetical protein
MEIRSFADLITPDERTLRFTPLGLSTAGTLKPEAAAEFQQLTIASADLIEAVPDSVRQSFERLRTCHSYGVLWYDAFTVAWRAVQAKERQGARTDLLLGKVAKMLSIYMPRRRRRRSSVSAND